MFDFPLTLYEHFCMLSNILCKHDLVTLYNASCGCIITVNLLIVGLWEFFIYIKLTLWYAIVNTYLIIVSGWDFRHRINTAKERNFCGTVSIMAVCFPLEIVPVLTLNIFQVLNENFFYFQHSWVFYCLMHIYCVIGEAELFCIYTGHLYLFFSELLAVILTIFLLNLRIFFI